MAKKSASEKTNVMRVLEQHKIAYTPHEYPHGKEAVDGASVAHLLGQDPAQVFDESVLNVPTIMVSAGKIGYQVECAPADLIGLVRAQTAAITTE